MNTPRSTQVLMAMLDNLAATTPTIEEMQAELARQDDALIAAASARRAAAQPWPSPAHPAVAHAARTGRGRTRGSL